LQVAYRGVKTRKPIQLPPLRYQPADHARWQAELLAGPAGDEQWAYWRTQLADAQGTLDLPFDRPRPPTQTFTGATTLFQWDDGLTAGLRATAKSHATTLYTLLLAAFHVQLYRYTGQEDISVGSSVDGRSRVKFSRTVGYLVNQLVLRANLSGNPTFSEFLQQ